MLELASLIGRIPHAGCSVALLGCRRDQIAHPLDGFGFVVPAIENRKIIACSMASVKFPGRAPEGKVLLRVFVGGALQPELMELPDDEIRKMVLQELGELIGLSGEPEFCEVARWQARCRSTTSVISIWCDRSKSEPLPFRISHSPATPIAASAYHSAFAAGKRPPSAVSEGVASAHRRLIRHRHDDRQRWRPVAGAMFRHEFVIVTGQLIKIPLQQEVVSENLLNRLPLRMVGRNRDSAGSIARQFDRLAQRDARRRQLPPDLDPAALQFAAR